MWYRVFIGRFSEKEAAIETAHRIKEAEKLDSVMMWQESSRS
jgi:cell division protein FtsN